MKLSKIQQIIKEEVAKAVESYNDELNDKFKKAVGFEKPAPGRPENRMKNKLYTFEYVFYFSRGSTDYGFEFVSVIAPNEQVARNLAYNKALIAHQSLRSPKEKFDLTSVENLEDIEAFKNISNKDIERFNNDELILADK